MLRSLHKHHHTVNINLMTNTHALNDAIKDGGRNRFYDFSADHSLIVDHHVKR